MTPLPETRREWAQTAGTVIAAAIVGWVTMSLTMREQVTRMEVQLESVEVQMLRIEARLDVARSDPFTGAEGRVLSDRIRDLEYWKAGELGRYAQRESGDGR